MGQFVDELRARKLDRIAAGYAVAAWVLIQAAAIVLPTFNAQPWVLRVLIIAGIAGFFVTMAGAWILMPAHPGATARTRRIFGAALAAGVVVAIALGVFAWTWSRETPHDSAQTATEAGVNSIAVLPFVDMSGDSKQDTSPMAFRKNS